MPLDFSPAKVAVVIDARSYTRELIEASGRFTLNIPAQAIASQVLAAGGSSGRDGDKFASAGIGILAGGGGGVPLIDGCVAWLECRVLPEATNQQRYDLFLGEVEAAWADPRAFRDGRWDFADDTWRTLHYIAGGQFFVTGPTLDAG
jgi:flavin reductase (DIM6/NTAB) family NADH-FMN oxidoreductase RutF